MISRVLRGLLERCGRSKSKVSSRQRRLSLESLESRQLLTLIGIVPNLPLIFYNSTGQFHYRAATQTLDMGATPLAFLLNGSSPPTPITGTAHVELHALVDNSGNLISGNGSPDFLMTGAVDVNGDSIVDYSGTLLTGKILQFGSKYNSGTSTSQFDFRFQFTGGLLQTQYAGMDIGVTMASENSSTFTGSFQTDFDGGAKGTVGPIAPLPTSIHGYKFNDLNGNGVDNSDPRLNGWTITLTGTDNLGNPVSKSTTTAGSGEYAFTSLAPGTYTVAEQQQTGWTQTLGGTQITLTSGQEAVSYAEEAGNLLPGQTEVLTTGLAFGNFKRSLIVLGMDKSPTTPQSVKVIDPSTGALLTQFVPYGNTFQGGVRVATGDLTNSGFDSIVTAPGRGIPSTICVFSQAGILLTQFQAYGTSVNGGVQVAVGDVDGDGLKDIITVPSYGPAEVRVFRNLGVVGGVPTFDGAHPYRDFLAFPSSFIGGAVVAVADMGSTPNNTPFVNTLDGKAEIIVGSGAGMKATVEVYDVSHMTSLTPTVRPAPATSFTPFSTSSTTFKGGVSISVARVNADSIPDIVVGAGCNGRSLVDVWAWNTATATLSSLSVSGSNGFAAFTDPSRNAPVQVTTLDSNGDGVADSIFAVQGSGGKSSQVVKLNILGVSPLMLSSPAAIPGNYPGPFTIAAINSVLSNLPMARSLATTSAIKSVNAAAVLASATTVKTTPKPTTPLPKWFFTRLAR